MAREDLTRRAHTTLRRAVALIMARSDYQYLLLGAPRLLPAAADRANDNPLVEPIRPYRRWLWRQRSIVTLARFLGLAMAYLVAVNVLLRDAVPSLPPILIWFPVIACVLAGAWLVRSNRPSLAETARWLDREFELHEQLGTALECTPSQLQGQSLVIHHPRPIVHPATAVSPTTRPEAASSAGYVQPDPLAQRQAARALARLQQLPYPPWQKRQRGSVLLALVLLLAGFFSTRYAAPAAPTAAPQGSYPLTQARSTGSLPQAIPTQASLAGLSPSADGSAKVPATKGDTHASPPAQSSLSGSFQIRSSPQPAGSGGTGPAPNPLAGSLTGGSAGSTVNGARSSNAGPSGAAQQLQAGSGNGSKSGAQGQTGQSTGSGKNGSPANQSGQPNAQQPQSGPSQNPQTGSPAQGSKTQSSQDQSQQGGQQTSGPNTSGKNPFGEDTPPPGTKGSQSGQNGQGGTKSAHAPAQGQSSAASSQSGSTGNGSGQSENGLQDPRTQRGNTGSGTGPTQNRPGSQQAESGQVKVTQVTVNGKPAIGSGNAQSPDLVPVAPYEVAPGPGLGAPNGESSTVEGYVPEADISSLPPDEQALIRAYFNGGSGS